MKLRHLKTYRTRDGKDIVKVSKVNNGTNYTFESFDGYYYQSYLPTGHTLSEKIDDDKDLVELIDDI